MKTTHYLLVFILSLLGMTKGLALTILGQPRNQSASLFAEATFSVRATSSQPLSYQWHFNAVPIAGAVSNVFTLTNIQKTNAGAYAVVINDATDSKTSHVASLTITRFNSIYCFGHSWTDTQYGAWPSSQYYNLHACNGPMWPEFLSTNLGLPYASTNNYAISGATSSDEETQTGYFTVPPKPQLCVYFLWAGGAELLQAVPNSGLSYGFLNVTNEPAWNNLIQTIVRNNSNTVNRLYMKGARSIVIQMCTDLSKTPLSLVQFGTNAAGLTKYSGYIARLNSALIVAMSAYAQARPDLRLVSVDVFSKLNEILLNPASYGLTKTTIDALDDPLLNNKSFTGPGADYVFWDNLHPTSKVQELMSGWYLEVLTNSTLEQLDVTNAGGLPTIQMNHLKIGGDYALQSSPDLTHWQDVQTFTAASGTNLWVGPSDAQSASFYRLKGQP